MSWPFPFLLQLLTASTQGVIETGILELKSSNFTHSDSLSARYWDTRQAQPVHTQQLPECCYALTVRYPLMVVGTAGRNLIVYNLQNPLIANNLIYSRTTNRLSSRESFHL